FIQSIQRAKNETGSYKTVLKGVLGSLMGPAGFAIAISSVTSLIVAFGPKIANFFSSFVDGADKIKNAKEQAELFKDTISSELDSRLGDRSAGEKLTVVQSAIDSLTGYNEIMEQAND